MHSVTNEVKRIAFIVPKIGPDQLCFQLIDNANNYLRGYDDVDVTIFFRQDGPRPVQPNFSIMCLFEAFGFNGDMLIATDLNGASRILTYPGCNPDRLYFYVWDLEWLRMSQKTYEQLRDIYANPKLKLIARSNTHAEILTALWQRPIAIIEDANLEEFAKLIRQNEEKKVA